MKHTFEQKVFYSDTDAYGVVWHGSYLRWLEMGRVYLCEMMGHNLIELKEQDIVLPVTNLNIKYKMSARLMMKLLLKREFLNLTGFRSLLNKQSHQNKPVKNILKRKSMLLLFLMKENCTEKCRKFWQNALKGL